MSVATIKLERYPVMQKGPVHITSVQLVSYFLFLSWLCLHVDEPQEFLMAPEVVNLAQPLSLPIPVADTPSKTTSIWAGHDLGMPCPLLL